MSHKLICHVRPSPPFVLKSPPPPPPPPPHGISTLVVDMRRGLLVLLAVVRCWAESPALALQRQTLLENPGNSYILISFPDDTQDMGIELIDDGAMIFFHMCSVRAAAGEPIAVRLMYRLLLDGARRSQLQRYGDVASHIRHQLTAEYGTDPRTVSDDARMVPEFPSEAEFQRALQVLFPSDDESSDADGWRARLRNAEAIAAFRGERDEL